MHTNWCVLIEISMEIGMLNFWLGLLVTALTKEKYFSNIKSFSQIIEQFCRSEQFWKKNTVSSSSWSEIFYKKINVNNELFIYCLKYFMSNPFKHLQSIASLWWMTKKTSIKAIYRRPTHAFQSDDGPWSRVCHSKPSTSLDMDETFDFDS